MKLSWCSGVPVRTSHISCPLHINNSTQPPPTSKFQHQNPGSFLHLLSSLASSPLASSPLTSSPTTLLHPFFASEPAINHGPTITPTPYLIQPSTSTSTSSVIHLTTRRGKHTSHSLSHHLFRFPRKLQVSLISSQPHLSPAQPNPAQPNPCSSWDTNTTFTLP